MFLGLGLNTHSLRSKFLRIFAFSSRVNFSKPVLLPIILKVPLPQTRVADGLGSAVNLPKH